VVQLFLIVALIIAILAVFFALQNAVAVTINFLIWKIESSLALVLLLSFGIGILMSLLVSFSSIMRKNWTISNQNKKIQKLENNIQELQKRFQGEIEHQSNQ
jgi:uncharacterized integral membrane protein